MPHNSQAINNIQIKALKTTSGKFKGHWDLVLLNFEISISIVTIS